MQWPIVEVCLLEDFVHAAVDVAKDLRRYIVEIYDDFLTADGAVIIQSLVSTRHCMLLLLVPYTNIFILVRNYS